MVDFRKKLGSIPVSKHISPEDIYDNLDRTTEKGPLRPAQLEVLRTWYEGHSTKKDVILKLHTGQGKTLVGLLMLQSQLNNGIGPALYLCPDKYLVEQTCDQAKSFGIGYVTMSDDIPDDFLDSKRILITTASKLFNGYTKFGLGSKSISIGAIIVDDAHTCIEYIKSSYRITLDKKSVPYQKILSLFEPELERQGVGTFADIKNGEKSTYLAVPYWEWRDKFTAVAKILSEHSELSDIKFAWQIIKDRIKECRCVISGDSLEIAPYTAPIEVFSSFNNAKHRVFMSATVSNDSFFIKDIGLLKETIENPISINNEKWSGEKMILIPSLIDASLDQQEIIAKFAKPLEDRKYGVVGLVSGFEHSKIWGKYGSTIATKDSIYSYLNHIREQNFNQTLVIVNRYDGVDLPDATCRILVIDSKPYGSSLEERYLEGCRSSSEVVAVKMAQKIEQGLGRGVRGEKDYCAIVLTGNDLVKAVRSKDTKLHFSDQTRMQVEIGLEIAEFAKEEMNNGKTPMDSFNGLIRQLLNRDPGWKDFYVAKMNEICDSEKKSNLLDILALEREAEVNYSQGKYEMAEKSIQKIIDKYVSGDASDKGWYLQEIARYKIETNKIDSLKMQIVAHQANPYLFKPISGMVVKNIKGIPFKRMENIISIASKYGTYEELYIDIDDITSNLRFGLDADRFEKAFADFGRFLGFISQRPDKEWSEGPDNLWKLDDHRFLLVECKNKVLENRDEINKDETGQMNNACAWFAKNYHDAHAKKIMIIPTKVLSKAAGFNEDVQVMRVGALKKLVRNFEAFYKDFKSARLDSISHERVHESLILHKLTVEDILANYSEEPTNAK